MRWSKSGILSKEADVKEKKLEKDEENVCMCECMCVCVCIKSMGVKKSPSVGATDFFQLGFSLLDFFLNNTTA